ncbi:MAG: haloacid dehalogenase type II [Gammaproteobacteria bacterium]|jgi:2-haloacid dehalogenase|nr:haloacid dehalogenase type II [Gammaproteobacteria bacterium]MBT3725190.1 haloacid dehalogenase type II [Gammaproteobacteria bacterium]MBT4076975.1 haloacid dehalogenase type II [Gammaproteobacteria bacterium]MBT4196122.1 haloacid dehalogenase type II [Gammaproteobacteria bacterium]MBT4450486.1 haloacid dehalogenase type II [Gammaproteobacteria bacterium]
MITLAFDVYGTLINTYGMVDLLQHYIEEDKAVPFATLWRDKQLEYSFRRSMMNRYQPFYTCTGDALDYCIEAFGVSITTDQHFSLIKRYQNLPVFKDVVKTLKTLRDRDDLQMYALTNGPLEDVEKLFEDDQINQYFKEIISADEIRKYKPDPAIYQHFLKRAGANAKDSWLISGNGFDVMGAGNCGMNSVWIKRDLKQQLDSWGEQPTYKIHSLSELNALI